MAKSTKKNKTATPSLRDAKRSIIKSNDPILNMFDEKVEAHVSRNHLPQEELIRIDNERRERGEALADQIFDYANKQRLTDPIPYINAIQDAIRGKNSEENQAILRTAVSYFQEHYRTWCRERGKSVKLIDNITHRTGKDTEESFAKLLLGFDVKTLSKTIWDLNTQKKFDELRIARRELYDLTNNQVRELREEYNTIPAQELAKLIHEALNTTNLTGEAKPDVDALIYIFEGRSSHEVKQIEFQFNEIYHFVRSGEGEPPLQTQLKQKVKDNPKLEQLIKGFSSTELASKVHHLLVHCAEASEVIEPNLELHPDFAGNFRRSYAKSPVIERELRAREEIDKLISFLSPTQFKNLNRQLEIKYKEHLTSNLYSCNHPFNPRHTAIKLFRAFNNVTPRRLCRKEQDYLTYSQLLEIKSRFSTSTSNEITVIINRWAAEQKASESYEIAKRALSPLRYLDPNQVFFVKEWFYICTGLKLDEFIENRLQELCRNEVPPYVERLVKERLTGTARLSLKADLFDIFSSAKERKENYLNLQPRKLQLAEAKEDALKIQKILGMNQESKRSKELIAFLKTRDAVQLEELERAFHDLSPEKSLIESIQQRVTAMNAQTLALLLLSNFNPEHEAELINNNLEHLLNLIPESPKAINFTLQTYKKKYKKDLLNEIKVHYKKHKSKEVTILLESVFFTPNVTKLYKSLRANTPILEEDINYLIKQLSRAPHQVLAFEAAYNRNFAMFSYCQSKNYGSLLQTLRVLATSGALEREYFAQAILLLENVDPSIAMTLKNHLNEENLGETTINKLHELLREFKNHLIILQKAFNALDEKVTLRETIYELKIPLNVKNKTLLLLDGYDPDAVAEEVAEVLSDRLSPEEIGESLLKLLAEPTKDAPNRRIPKFQNWVGEMYHQIRVSYEALTGKKLIAELISKKVPMKGAGVNAIAYKLYGDVSKSVIDIKKLIDNRPNPAQNREVTDRKIAQILADNLPELRERLIDMYDAYFSIPTNEPTLQDQIKAIDNETVRNIAENLYKEAYS